MAKHGKKSKGTPKEQAIGAGKGGIVPPIAKRFKRGQSGNPGGRRTAGATIKEWINSLAERGLTERQLREVARDTLKPWTERAAAERVIRTLEAGDMAEMEPLLEGEMSLIQLREAGVNTEVIKKIKVKRKTIWGDGEAVGNEVEREVELHDRAGVDFDRIIDRTEGKPGQNVKHTGPDGGPIEVTIDPIKAILADPAAAELADALARRMAFVARGDGESSN